MFCEYWGHYLIRQEYYDDLCDDRANMDGIR